MHEGAHKTALITGIAGQDGAYLAEFLLSKGYKVHGLLRWDSYVDPLIGVERLDRLGLIDDRITLHTGDVTDGSYISRLIKSTKPDEIYNLAAMSHVAVSFETPASSFDINTKGTLHILEAVWLLGMQDHVRVYQASSSEMFGSAPAPQNEETPFAPCSPYGVAKLASYWLCRTYRDSYGVHVSNGILFNHESPLRGEDFVTQKIVQHVVEVERGSTTPLELGNLDSVRDWGHARDYVRGMWMMLQEDKPDDYVLATGQALSVRHFVERAYAYIGRDIEWYGQGAEEVGKDRKTGKILVKVNERFFRPNEVDYLLGDAAKASEKLGWAPQITFDDLIADMINTARGVSIEKQDILWPKMAG